ncbi:MAG: Ig-like domain-containing protein [bacterium]
MPVTASLHPGDTLRVTVSNPACGQPNVIHFRWVTSDAKVATVDSLSGLVTARGTGAATIIAQMVEESSIKGAMVVRVDP